MAAHGENGGFDQQAWDMEFKDPFSSEGDLLTLSCSGVISQSAVATTSSFSGSHSAVDTFNDGLVQTVSSAVKRSLQTVPGDPRARTSRAKLLNCNENPQQRQLEVAASTCLGIKMSVDGSKGVHRTNESVVSCANRLFHDTNVELDSSKIVLASSKEQLPIPVVLSSGKRFCAREDIENSQSDEESSPYDEPPSATSIPNNLPVCAAQFTCQPTVYNIPAWPSVSLSLLPNNSATSTAWQLPAVMPYAIAGPYSAICPHSASIPVLHNQPVVGGTAASLLAGARMHLQNVVTMPNVSRAPLLDLQAIDSGVPHKVPAPVTPVPCLLNGLMSPAVQQAFPPFLPPDLSRLRFVTSAYSGQLPHQCHPHIAVSPTAYAGLPLVSSVHVSPPHCDSAAAEQPKSLSANAGISVVVSSSAVLKHNETDAAESNNNKHLVPSDKMLPSVERLRHTLPVTDKSSLTAVSTGVSKSCKPVISSKCNETVTAPSTSCSSIPPPPQTKPSSTFAQLDPRLRNAHQQNSGPGPSAQSGLSDSAPLAQQNSDFIVPVPPPLPSLAELTADKDTQKQQVPAVGLTSPSAVSDAASTDSAQLDKMLADRTKVVEERVRASLKPFFKSGVIDKDNYKQIMRKAVPKICASRSADISTTRVDSFIEAYVAKVTTTSDRRKSGGSSSSSNTSRCE